MTDDEYLKIIEDAKVARGVGPYFVRAEVRDMLAFAKMIAARVETYQCECGADDACEFVRQRDAALAGKYATEPPAKWARLYAAINTMMAPLGAYGKISARDDRVQAVMDALYAIDAAMLLSGSSEAVRP